MVQMPDAAAVMRTRCVGRRRELAAIEQALAAARAGRGRIVVVSGEPGIGKSRLLAEVAHRASEAGVPVAWGRSLEDGGAPPFLPWRQILRAVDASPADGPSDGDMARASLASRIDPDLTVAGADRELPRGADLQGAERFGVFESVGELLRAAAAPAGLLVLLDDVHWADTASLRLLEHVAHGWGDMRALLIAAHRPVGAERDAALRHTLGELSRMEGTVRIALEGLTAAETAERLADLTGRQVPAATVATLRDRTGGNPFFISEFGRLLAESPASDASADRDVPQSVRDVIARRVSGLTGASQKILEVAAVVGAHPSPNVIAEVLEIPIGDVLTSFDEAADGALFTRDTQRIEYSFAHALLRDALYAELPAAQRVQWHARVAMQLQQRSGVERAAHLSELAYHWLQAMPGGYAEPAMTSAAAAAEAAMEQLAYEEAARLFEAAAGASLQAGAEPARRAQLVLSAARGRFLAGELDRAAVLCEDVARLARTTNDSALLSDAALVLEGVGDRQLSAMIAGLCDEALEILPDDAVQVRSRLLAQLTTAKLYLDDYEPLDRLSRAALEGAERSGDDDTLAAALRARHIACSDASRLEERIAVTERLLDMAQRSRRSVDEAWARLWRFDSLLQMGLLDDAAREIDTIALLADRIKLPLINWHLERCRFAAAQVRGDFGAARRAAEAGDHFARAAGELARPRRPMQQLLLAVVTGDDVDEAIAALDPHPERPEPQLPSGVLIARQTMALSAAFRDDTDRAGAIYDALPRPERMSLMPPAGLIASGQRGMLAALLARREDSAAMYARLLPWADLFMSAGAGAVASFGSVELPLGMLARTLGRGDAAVKHLERAVERSDSAGMRPSAAEARYQLALALQSRARAGDVAAALPLISASLESANALGMCPLAARATALRESLRAGTRQARLLTPREMEIARLVAEGLTSREIADAMHISSRTADNHVQHILEKLDLRSRSQIATWVVRGS